MFTAHFNKSLHTSINILFAMNSRDLYPDTGLALGNNRVAEANDIDAY